MKVRLREIPRWAAFRTATGRIGVVLRRRGEEVSVALAAPFERKRLHRDVVVDRRSR